MSDYYWLRFAVTISRLDNRWIIVQPRRLIVVRVNLLFFSVFSRFLPALFYEREYRGNPVISVLDFLEPGSWWSVDILLSSERSTMWTRVKRNYRQSPM